MGSLIEFPIRRVKKQHFNPQAVADRLFIEADFLQRLLDLGYDRSTIALRMVDFRLNVRKLTEIAAQEYPK